MSDNGHAPALKRGFTHKEFLEWNSIMRVVSRYENKLANTPDSEWDKVNKEIEAKEADKNKRLYELLAGCYSVRVEDFDDLPNKTVEQMIDEVYTASTLQKNLGLSSQTPSPLASTAKI